MTTQSKTMQELWQDSYLAGNEEYLEEMYEAWLGDPTSVAPEWNNYFNQLAKRLPRSTPDISHAAVREQFLQLARQSAKATAVSGIETHQDQKQDNVAELIAAYRRLGHLRANIDPLNMYQGIYSPTLELAYYGFTDQDLTKTFNVGSFAGLNKATATLGEIHQALRRVYSNTIGFEYMHINRVEEVEWIRERIEQGWANFKPNNTEKLRILNKLVVADGLEKYLGFKYVGQKRFSLEGGDSLIPLLDTVVNRSAENGIKEIVIGMAHRGRLNVLVNVLGKESATIFAAFEGKGINESSSGDVKYHLGYSTNIK